MCLGIPGKVVSISPGENQAVIESFGIQNKVNIFLVEEEVKIGDYLVVHAGYAIGKVNLQEAQERLKLLEEILVAE